MKNHIPLILNSLKLFTNPKTKAYKELKNYSDIVLTKDIYDYLQTQNPTIIKDRTEAKSAMFYILFSHPKIINPYKTAFKNTFPSIHKFINLIKRKILKQSDFYILKSNGTIIKKPQYKSLAIILQRIESLIFIDNIAEDLYINKPNIPFLTLHDSIFVQSKNSVVIKDYIANKIKALTGYSPTLKLEAY